MAIFEFLQEFNLYTVLIRVFLAALFGGLIGSERGRHGRAAGLRTHILVCVGSAMTSLTGLFACGAQVILYFPDEVAEVLADYLKERRQMTPQPGHENALFLSLQNKRISVRAVQMMVKKYALPAAPLKKHLSPHKLRSTFGTNLYHETGDIDLVADVLGHSDVNTTKQYYVEEATENLLRHRNTFQMRKPKNGDS